MNILMSSDHGGFVLKDYLYEYYKNKYNVKDFGIYEETRVDYPDMAKLVCEALKDEVSTDEAFGILVCGSGIGMSIASNRYKHIRAALCTDSYNAYLARFHNNANILCLGGRITGFDMATNIVDTFLNTNFEGGRHTQRVEKLYKGL